MYGCESWTLKKAELWRIDALELWCWEDSWESFGLQRDQTSQSWRESTPNINWKDWSWSWSSSTLATWRKEMIHWRRPGKIEGRRRGRGQDGCMVSSTQYAWVWAGWTVSLTQWTWVWASSRRWWRIGKPGVLQSMGSQRVGHDLVRTTRTTKWTDAMNINNFTIIDERKPP